MLELAYLKNRETGERMLCYRYELLRANPAEYHLTPEVVWTDWTPVAEVTIDHLEYEQIKKR